METKTKMRKRKKFLSVIPGLILLTLFCVPSSFAQKPSQSDEDLKALRQEIEAVKAGQTAIQKQLQEIKDLLKTMPVAGQPAAPAGPDLSTITMDLKGEPFKGDKNARIVLVEFSDYQCPFCARFVSETSPQIDKEYIQSGKVKYVFRNLPLTSIHANAFKAAEAAACAGDQNKFWEMHDRLYKNQQKIALSDLSSHAESIGLDKAQFDQCLASDKYAEKIRKDMAEANKVGVTGTPTFFVAVVDPKDSKLKFVQMMKGAQPFSNFKAYLDGLLAAQKP
jgi:protein-disulfide isomerase